LPILNRFAIDRDGFVTDPSRSRKKQATNHHSR